MKHNVYDVVWVMDDNKPTCMKVYKASINADLSWPNCGKKTYVNYELAVSDRMANIDGGDEYHEDLVFSTKKELLESLLKDE